MTTDEIRQAVEGGAKAADVAARARVPITEVHRIVYGRGYAAHQARTEPCLGCKRPVLSRARSHRIVLCERCRRGHLAAQSQATTAVRKAVAVGMLKPVRECACADCGKPAEHYDHRDYSYPLRVEPVCRSCNIKRGPALGAAA